ncbi:hypothetical protein B0H17DRAFT_1193680 [Mycena rosella]|uniref:Uncharacterized protein n=1 Tax=Mycena rosella TaxID=1033263 RepID=A0AAD7GSN7_MYCRO|nr:hypothetical protein B0H17DRAFT_1193680 [Mycena rosella]
MLQKVDPHVVCVTDAAPLTLTVDLLNPSTTYEQRQHKLKHLVQSPNSYFMDVKCITCLL